jgi:tetratricopeptide (TPR) repeat protein
MNRLIKLAIAAGAAAMFTGCASIQALLNSGDGGKSLASGISEYEQGNYRKAAALLQASLDQGLPARSDRVKARKHLAFIHCISGRHAQCREQFRSTLRIDPSFELAANEAGHPIWGPVFRSVKSRYEGPVF